MAIVSKIDPETVPAEVREAIRQHLEKGYKLTNEKLTLLHNVAAFEAIEEGSYAVDRELQRIVGERAANFFEYAISVQNECLVCTTYFKKLLDSQGIDIHTFEFTEEEKLLMEYGQALAKDPRHIPGELMDRLRAKYDEEALVVLTSMGIMMLANNYFNDIMEVEV